ncbi:hypothetical protein FAUST_11318 [Fusarium austroamericanum]|uniref:Uncharacterized protein n=1 Tax=Fusarium austroamericanum TaxID=282268 RepID=A0AAN6BV83_FUSAU|nr:hypothetical protein FAUST_11318 [Fusarium austroamericanum]
MASDSGSLAVAIFTALGTIVGYLGGEVASASVFNRILWPERYNNSIRPSAVLWTVALMPMGGPLTSFCRGDMLGSAFYKDMGHKYVAHADGSTTREVKSARNALWITVMELVARDSDHHQHSSSSCPGGRLEVGRSREQNILSQRPFLILKLKRDDPKAVPTSLVTGDIGSLRLRYIAGIFASEAICIVFGIASAVKWKTPSAIWYFVPLILKLIALLCYVRRQPGKLTEDFKPPGDGGLTFFEVEDKSKGFFNIVGNRQVVYQIFHYHGHPLRDKLAFRGSGSAEFSLDNLGELAGDRVRELISMLSVIAFIFVYPAGLILFLFTAEGVQWMRRTLWYNTRMGG